jgi:hypothetical protein
MSISRAQVSAQTLYVELQDMRAEQLVKVHEFIGFLSFQEPKIRNVYNDPSVVSMFDDPESLFNTKPLNIGQRDWTREDLNNDKNKQFE